MKAIGFAAALIAALVTVTTGQAQDDAAKKDLAPTGKLRVGLAVGPTPGAGNVARDESSGGYRGVAVDLGKELAQKLAVPVEFVAYSSSGSLTEAAPTGNWDVAFIPVDAERKKFVDFGSAHIVLQSTYLVAPNSSIKSLADVDRADVRVFGVDGTATARAAAKSLKTAKLGLVKTGGELFELLKSGKADAIALSRESLVALGEKLPGSRVLDEAYLNSFVAIALPKGRPAGLVYASTYIDEAIKSGSVRRALDSIGMKSSTVPPPGTKP